MKIVLIVEDQPAIRAFLQDVALSAFPGIGAVTAGTLAQALTQVDARRFDLALIDLGLPDGSGIEVLGALRRLQPHCLAVVVTIYDDDAHLFPALQAGAYGYLLKEQASDLLVGQLLRITEGEPPLSPPIARRMLSHFALTSKLSGAARLAPPGAGSEEESLGLTARETEVLQHVATGLNLHEIAEQFGLSKHTISTYVKQIYRKLNITSRAEATMIAVRRGLVQP